MILSYEAVDHQGQSRADSIEAIDESEARQRLRGQGLYVTRIERAESRDVAHSSSPPASRKGGCRLPPRILAQMTRQLAMLLRAGSGIVPALSAIARQQRRPEHVAVFQEVVNSLEEGQTLTDALRKQPRAFGPIYTAIVAAGEASGTLAEMLERLSTIVGKARTLRKKILGALAYPALLTAMCFGITLVLLFFVLPRFNDMFVQLGVETPAVTHALLSLGVILRNGWPFVFVGIALSVFAGSAVFASEAGRQWASDVQLRIPMIGRLRRRLILGQVLRTMGMLLDSRVGILETIELVRRSTRNRRFQSLFGRLEEAVTSGNRVSGAFEDSGVTEPFICQAIHTGEDSGNLGGAMLFCADVMDEDNEELVTLLMRLLEPLILIVMGVFVGGVASSLFIPLFDMTSAIR